MSLHESPERRLPGADRRPPLDIEHAFVRPPEFTESEKALVTEFAMRRDAAALKMDDPYFRQTKDSEKIRMQKERMRKLAEQFEEGDSDMQALASSLEYVVTERINGDSKWLGEHMQARLTTPFDDRVNGIDLYVEDSRSGGKPVGVSMDVTFSSKRSVIRGKIEQLKAKQLDGGRLAPLHYYKPLSSHDVPPGDVVLMPKVVVGVDRASALAAVGAFASAEKNGTEASDRDWKTGVALLYQTAEQLRAFIDYSSRAIDEKRMPHVAATKARYQEALADVMSVFDELKFNYAAVRQFAMMNPSTKLLIEELKTQLGYVPAD